MSKINYYVIGGKDNYICYGGTFTLLGAKILAHAHKEYWGRDKTPHIPNIYRAKDTMWVNSNGNRNDSADMIIVPKANAFPIR